MSDSTEQKSFTLQTASFDARFPNQNQTKHCWQKYVSRFSLTTPILRFSRRTS